MASSHQHNTNHDGNNDDDDNNNNNNNKHDALNNDEQHDVGRCGEEVMTSSCPPVTITRTCTTASVEDIARRLYCGAGLGPMVRASTTPLRTLAIKYGAKFVYTEELIDRSISSTIRVENEMLNTIDYVKDSTRLSAKQQRRLKEDEGPALFLRIDRKVESEKLICQIGSGDPELALAAALHVHRDVDAIDLNMGCPKKFSVKGGMGSALLSDPDRACQIIRTLSDAMTPLCKPVSGKIRLLKDTQSTVDFVTGLINAGASAVAIHGRRVGDPEVRAADWESLEEVVALVKSKHPRTPILVNGDFYTRDEFTKFQLKCGADGVLLARPALYNTSLFRKPIAIIDGSKLNNHVYDYKSPLLLDRTSVIQDYLREAITYDIHYKNIKYVTSEMMNSRRAPFERVPYLPQHFPGGQTIGMTCSCNSLKEICHLWNIDYDRLVNDRQDTREFVMKQSPVGEHKYSDSYILQATGTVGLSTSDVITLKTCRSDNEIAKRFKDSGSYSSKRLRMD